MLLMEDCMISRKTVFILGAVLHISFIAQSTHAGLWQMASAPFSRLAAYAKQRPAFAIAGVVGALAVCGGIYYWHKMRPTKKEQFERALRINEDLCKKVHAAKELLINMCTISLKKNLIQGLAPLFKDIRVYRYPGDLEFKGLDCLYRRMLRVSTDVDLASLNQTIITYLNEYILEDLTQNCTRIRKQLSELTA